VSLFYRRSDIYLDFRIILYNIIYNYLHYISVLLRPFSVYFSQKRVCACVFHSVNSLKNDCAGQSSLRIFQFLAAKCHSSALQLRRVTCSLLTLLTTRSSSNCETCPRNCVRECRVRVYCDIVLALVQRRNDVDDNEWYSSSLLSFDALTAAEIRGIREDGTAWRAADHWYRWRVATNGTRQRVKCHRIARVVVITLRILRLNPPFSPCVPRSRHRRET